MYLVALKTVMSGESLLSYGFFKTLDDAKEARDNLWNEYMAHCESMNIQDGSAEAEITDSQEIKKKEFFMVNDDNRFAYADWQAENPAKWKLYLEDPWADEDNVILLLEPDQFRWCCREEDSQYVEDDIGLMAHVRENKAKTKTTKDSE